MSDKKHWGDTDFGRQVGEATRDIVKDTTTRGVDLFIDILRKKTGTEIKKENNKPRPSFKK